MGSRRSRLRPCGIPHLWSRQCGRPPSNGPWPQYATSRVPHRGCKSGSFPGYPCRVRPPKIRAERGDFTCEIASHFWIWGPLTPRHRSCFSVLSSCLVAKYLENEAITTVTLFQSGTDLKSLQHEGKSPILVHHFRAWHVRVGVVCRQAV